MIDRMIKTMSDDMRVNKYSSESDESFIARVCYSALGQWCLVTGMNTNDDEIGSSKHYQTNFLNELMTRYLELYPHLSSYFQDSSLTKESISVMIRRVYEETGYLITHKKNNNKIADYGRSMLIGDRYIFFGYPETNSSINGLGVFCGQTNNSIEILDFLIRDKLTVDEYIKTKYDPIDFSTKDIQKNELEFFNPLQRKSPSLSWIKDVKTEYSIARKTDSGPFYRIIKTDNGLLFADEPAEDQKESFTSYEYRRLYFALKYHYSSPLDIKVEKLDNEYSRIKVGGYLPNREYYLLLLLAWPQRSAFDRVNFIIRNCFLSDIVRVFENIGVKSIEVPVNDKS